MNTLHNVIPTQLNSCIINTFCCVCVRWGNKKPIKFGSPSVTCRPQTIPFRTRKGSQMSPRHLPAPLSLPLTTFLAPANIITVCQSVALVKLAPNYPTQKTKKKKRKTHLLPNKQDPMVFTLLSTPYLLWCCRTAFPSASSVCFITSSSTSE